MKPTEMNPHPGGGPGGAGQWPTGMPSRPHGVGTVGADVIRRLHLRLLTVGPCRGHIIAPSELNSSTNFRLVHYHYRAITDLSYRRDR